MKIISFIEDEQLVKKILRHLDLWNVKPKPPPCANDPPPESFIIYDELSSPGADDPPSISSRDKFRLRFCFFGVTCLPSVLFLRRDKLPDRC
jgi:hypothetical protein